MRTLDDAEVLRKYLLTGCLEQEGGTPILVHAPDRGDEMTIESARQLRREQHRRAARGQAAGAQAAQRALRGMSADHSRRLDRFRVTCDRVPVVALHLLILLRDQSAAQRMAGARVAGEKAVAVAVHAHAAMGRECRAL